MVSDGFFRSFPGGLELGGCATAMGVLWWRVREGEMVSGASVEEELMVLRDWMSRIEDARLRWCFFPKSVFSLFFSFWRGSLDHVLACGC